MFEKIVLRRSEDGLPPTVGDLAEALLFYRHVHLMLDRDSLRSLASSIGMDRLIDLLRSKTVSAVYCRDMLCTYTQKDGALEHHHFAGMQIVGKDGHMGRARPYSVREEIEDCIKATMKNPS